MKVLITLALLISSAAFSKERKIEDIIKSFDHLYRAESSYVKMEMKIVTPHWERTMLLNAWGTKLDKTFIRILSPRKDAGISTLRINNDMWNYFPKVDKVIKVPPSMRMGAWMGSDFTNDDLVKESSLTADYNYQIVKGEDREYVVSLTPRPNTISLWDRVVLHIDKSSELPTKQMFFDERGELVRTMYFKEVKKLGGKVIPTVLELISNKKIGNKTIVKYLDAKFNIKIKRSVFTRKNLQKRR